MKPGGRRHHRFVLTGVVVAAALLAACGSDAPVVETVPEPGAADLGGRTVLVLGDSLTMQSEAELQALADDHVYGLEVFARSGHTPCDAEAVLDAALADDPPDLVVLAYAGNSWLYSACLGGEGQTVDESVDRYREIVGSMIHDVREADSTVGIVGGPVWPANSLAEPVHDALAELARDRDVAFVDGGRWVTPGRTWSETVPCRPDEPGCVDGRVEVHLRDGFEEHDVHFDCDVAGWRIADDVPCPGYSAGGYRYARAIDGLIVDLAGSGVVAQRRER